MLSRWLVQTSVQFFKASLCCFYRFLSLLLTRSLYDFDRVEENRKSYLSHSPAGVFDASRKLSFYNTFSIDIDSVGAYCLCYLVQAHITIFNTCFVMRSSIQVSMETFEWLLPFRTDCKMWLKLRRLNNQNKNLKLTCCEEDKKKGKANNLQSQ